MHMIQKEIKMFKFLFYSHITCTYTHSLTHADVLRIKLIHQKASFVLHLANPIEMHNLYSIDLNDVFSLSSVGTPVNRIPIMAKQVLDLYMLYKLVTEKGGLVEVINKKIWREITKGLNLPTSITSAAFTLRTQWVFVSHSQRLMQILCQFWFNIPHVKKESWVCHFSAEKQALSLCHKYSVCVCVCVFVCSISRVFGFVCVSMSTDVNINPCLCVYTHASLFPPPGHLPSSHSIPLSITSHVALIDSHRFIDVIWVRVHNDWGEVWLTASPPAWTQTVCLSWWKSSCRCNTSLCCPLAACPNEPLCIFNVAGLLCSIFPPALSNGCSL